jgi:hypothetical protein
MNNIVNTNFEDALRSDLIAFQNNKFDEINSPVFFISTKYTDRRTSTSINEIIDEIIPTAIRNSESLDKEDLQSLTPDVYVFRSSNSANPEFHLHELLRKFDIFSSRAKVILILDGLREPSFEEIYDDQEKFAMNAFEVKDYITKAGRAKEERDFLAAAAKGFETSKVEYSPVVSKPQLLSSYAYNFNNFIQHLSERSTKEEIIKYYTKALPVNGNGDQYPEARMAELVDIAHKIQDNVFPSPEKNIYVIAIDYTYGEKMDAEYKSNWLRNMLKKEYGSEYMGLGAFD